MVTREQVVGHWNEVKGRLKENWGELTENDLQRAEGSAEQLVGIVQKKTGATRSEVEDFIDGLFGEEVRSRAKETAQHYTDMAQQMASEAGEFAREKASRLADQTGRYSERVADTVRSRPTGSLAIAFAVGIAAGAFLFWGRKK